MFEFYHSLLGCSIFLLHLSNLFLESLYLTDFDGLYLHLVPIPLFIIPFLAGQNHMFQDKFGLLNHHFESLNHQELSRPYHVIFALWNYTDYSLVN